ncbi:MAG: dTMP kinase [Thermoleophilia bacterium]
MGQSAGVLVSLEGCDGCGKTTQAQLLCARLVAAGYPVGPHGAPGTVIREPGGTACGEAIRELLLHTPVHPEPWTEALLYAAARAELVADVLKPELARGRVLVLDRYVDSSLAYQGWARGLGIDEVFAVNHVGMQGVLPEITVVLRVDPAVCAARLTKTPDRIEAQGVEFQHRVSAGFAMVAEKFPQRVREVDGGGGVETVAEAVAALVLPVIEMRAK